MKIRKMMVTAGLSLVVASTPLFASGDHADSHDSHGSSHDSHDSMKMDHDKMDHDKMTPVKLVPAKKSESKSKNRHFLAYSDLVPEIPGWAVFKTRLTTKAGKDLSPDAKISGTLEMPGMAMDSPPVKIKRLSPSEWELSFQIPMAGFWKVHLDVENEGTKDRVDVKFVTKEAS